MRHNLDVTQVEKNVASSIVSTLLHCGKSKDGLNARKDLQNLGIRKDLWPNSQGKRTYLPAAPWSLSKKENKFFCKRLFDFKGPDGYCSNISRGVSLDDCKISGLKSHDYHVLLQQLLPGCSNFFRLHLEDCFQVKTRCRTDMQEKQVHLLKQVNELQEELTKLKNQVRDIR